jgi:hypothetical protein
MAQFASYKTIGQKKSQKRLLKIVSEIFISGSDFDSYTSQYNQITNYDGSLWPNGKCWPSPV